MRKPEQILDAIFRISNTDEFNTVALEVYRYQYAHTPVYREFCELLGNPEPNHFSEIPFLPIELFKTQQILDDSIEKEEVIFLSSGTTGSARSAHYVADLSVYERSFFNAFKQFFGEPENCVILGLLPNYIEQGSSSLVYMVNKLIERSKFAESGFYLQDYARLGEVIRGLQNRGISIILFGVSYALLDLAERNMNLSGVTIVETGGMKGRRKELVKEELHRLLKSGLNVPEIASEYGMTELLSQAYALRDGKFQTPPWMKVLVRDTEDPLTWLAEGKTGGISVIDLANLHSCSFIHTQDLGKVEGKHFYIAGRFDQSDIRGCNLLVNV